MQKIWLISGCSTGFGRALALEALHQGNKVGVSARKTDDIQDIINKYPQTAIAIKLDVTDEAEIASATSKITAHFGGIDVLVNNAGIGYFGAIEESEDSEVRRMFDINVFGLANMTKAVLPITAEAKKRTHRKHCLYWRAGGLPRSRILQRN